MYSLGVNLNSQQLEDLFNQIDTDKSGEIEFGEFAVMMSKKFHQGALKSEQEEIVSAFKLFDLNNDGTVTAQELRTVMNSLGANLKPEEVELLIKEADTDCNGELDLDEFTTFMMTK